MTPSWSRLLLFSVAISTSDGVCRRQTFRSLSRDVWTPGDVIAEYRHVTPTRCERTCRQTLECAAYHVAPSGRGQSCRLLFGALVVPEHLLTETHPPPGQIFTACPDGFFPHLARGKCYHFSRIRLNWDSAMSYCTTLNPQGHLADIADQREQWALLQIADHEKTERLWLSARRDSGGAYTWANSGKPISTFWWAERDRQPTGSLLENCVSLDREARGWFDDLCFLAFHAACEFSL